MFLLAFAESIQLVPDGSLFIHIAIILLMIWLLNRTLFRPINRVLEAREKSKGGLGGEAAGILSQVSEKEAAYTREMLEARSRGYEMIEQEHAAAAKAREQQLSQTKQELAAKLDAERKAIEQQAAAARAEIEREAEEISDKISATILKV